MGENKMNTSIVALVLLAASTSSAVAQQQRTHQLPTATEVFNLRSRCAALGERMLEENVIGSALTQSQISHYEPANKSLLCGADHPGC
jgi:hypothetical protein